MGLAKDNLPLGPMQRPPAPDPPLQCPAVAHPVAIGMTPFQLLENGDRPQARHGLEQRQDVQGPDGVQRTRWGRPSRAACQLLRRQPRVPVDASRGALAEPGLGGGHGLRVRLSVVHVNSHLLVGDPSSRHDVLFLGMRTSSPSTHRDQQGEGSNPRLRWGQPTVGLRPPFS